MFGYHKARRERKKQKREMENLKKEQEYWSPQKQEAQRQQNEALKNQAYEETKKMEQIRDTARDKGKKRAEEVFSRDVEGLTPQQKKNMESTAQRRLNRDMQGYERKLLAQQGRAGVKGGAAYAQQADLARIGSEAQGQYQRDLSQLDSDLSLKKLAAMFNIEEGEAAQAQLDRQLAIDEANLENERIRQRWIEDQYNRLFTKV